MFLCILRTLELLVPWLCRRDGISVGATSNQIIVFDDDILSSFAKMVCVTSKSYGSVSFYSLDPGLIRSNF